MTSLAVVAGATRHATIGTCVLQLPLRSPAAVAKQAATLQLLSGGRMVLGVGAGSHAGEYRRAGCDFTSRGRRLDEAILELRAAWSSADEPGAAYRQEPAVPAVPVWVGGSSDAARRRAATLGDGWIPLFVDPPRLAEGLGHLGDEAQAAGRDPGSVTGAVVVAVRLGEGRQNHERGCGWLSELYGIPPRSFDRHLVSGPAAACAERITAFADAGARHVALLVADDVPLDHLAALAQELGVRAGPTGGGASGPPPGADDRQEPRLAGVGA
jgi:alkanesulfonate monooxygenase SsuD/methylene tetrahydromethanopterin reductase-like flavin-dependent oxidoreductase (luciferase family)